MGGKLLIRNIRNGDPLDAGASIRLGSSQSRGAELQSLIIPQRLKAYVPLLPIGKSNRK